MNCPHYIAISDTSEEGWWRFCIDLICIKPAPPVACSCPAAMLVEKALSKGVRKRLERLTVRHNGSMFLRHLIDKLPSTVVASIVQNIDGITPVQGCLQGVANDVCFILDNQKSEYLQGSPGVKRDAPELFLASRLIELGIIILAKSASISALRNPSHR